MSGQQIRGAIGNALVAIALVGLLIVGTYRLIDGTNSPSDDFQPRTCLSEPCPGASPVVDDLRITEEDWAP